jgi:hypothetical protein
MGQWDQWASQAALVQAGAPSRPYSQSQELVRAQLSHVSVKVGRLGFRQPAETGIYQVSAGGEVDDVTTELLGRPRTWLFAWTLTLRASTDPVTPKLANAIASTNQETHAFRPPPDTEMFVTVLFYRCAGHRPVRSSASCQELCERSANQTRRSARPACR